MAKATLSGDTERIIRLVPGYDPFAHAAGCWFDEKAAKLAMDFFPECLTHVEGSLAGQPFTLEGWQRAIIANLFGWKRKDKQGRTIRRYREAFIFVGRKNGKSPLAAGIGLYHLFCDPEKGQQNYVAASTAEQAGLLFRHAKGMVEQEPELANRCRIYGGSAPGGQSQSIVREDVRSFLKIVAGDAKLGRHGKNTNLFIVDELHEIPSRDLVDSFRTGMASENKPQPLGIYLTTSDYHRPSICNELHDRACRVRDGTSDDPWFLPVIYEASKDDDWTLPETWRKANPNLGVSVSEQYLADECRGAQEFASREIPFKRFHLNIKTDTAVQWLRIDQWDASDGPVDQDALAGKPCWCGLDLSTTTDLSAFAMVFPAEGGGYDVLCRFWVPGENAEQRERRDRVPYTLWIREGWITATPGDVIDYDAIRRDINELGQRFDIREIAADRWNAQQIITQLAGDGFTIFPFGQGFASMTSPTKELEKLVVAGQIRFGRNPVLRWMARNVAVETDAAGNLKPTKAKSTERIDGIVATIMGLGRAALQAGGESVYQSRGVEYAMDVQ